MSDINHSNLHESSKGRSSKQKYFGHYLGIVVQNNDPEKRGRVKVFVPHVSPTVYKNWLSVNTKKKFKFIGNNIDSDLTLIIDELRDILPWSECAAPLAGESSSGRYNAYTKLATTSDGNISSLSFPSSASPTKYSLNKENISEKPGRLYEVNTSRVNDAFNGTDIESSRILNKYSHNYIPSTYSNTSKGSFSIPRVGSHLWCFFTNGDPMFPIYFAVSYNQEDWKGIYELNSEGTPDYPSDYENSSVKETPNYGPENDKYRNKWVMSQKGGVIEIVNTDNREVLRFTHYSGSFIEFNNNTAIEFNSKNKQTLTQGDEFKTIRGNKALYVDGILDQTIRGDVYRTVGYKKYDKFSSWREIMREIADAKQLFDIRRADYVLNEIYQDVSPLQVKSPGGLIGHAPCPLCSAEGRQKYWKNNHTLISYSNVNRYDSPPPNGSTQPAGTFTTIVDMVDDSASFSNVSYTGGSLPEFIQGPTAPRSFLGEVCPVCLGTGKSPSSQNGNFTNENKDSEVIIKLRDKIKQLTELERELGIGGSEIVTIAKHRVENIGLLMNNFPAIRVDYIGKAAPGEVYILPEGVVNAYEPAPVIELVHVDDLPGGNASLNVANKYNVTVGSGGINIKTTGVVNFGGVVTNIAGKQVNIGSELETNISSKRVTIDADYITLKNRKFKQVVVEGNLGVTQNVIIGGGLHVEGELSVNHITAPVEIQETEEVILQGWIDDENVQKMQSTGPGGPIILIDPNDPVLVHFAPHSHQFRNIPLTLTTSNVALRKIAAVNQNASKAPSMPVRHEKKVDVSL